MQIYIDVIAVFDIKVVGFVGCAVSYLASKEASKKGSKKGWIFCPMVWKGS